MKCGECRFSRDNTEELEKTCSDYRKQYNFENGGEYDCSEHNYKYFQPILKSGMKVRFKRGKNNIYTLAEQIDSLEWRIKEDYCKSVCINIMDFDVITDDEKVKDLILKSYNDDSINKLKVVSTPESVIRWVGADSNSTNKKEKKMEINKYEFKGEFNLDLTMNDMFRDMKRSFVIIGRENAVVGILQNYYFDIEDVCYDIDYVDGEFINNDEVDDGFQTIEPYFFKIIDKYEVHEWLKTLKEENKYYNKVMLRMKDEIKKKVKKGTNTGDRFKVFSV